MTERTDWWDEMVCARRWAKAWKWLARENGVRVSVLKAINDVIQKDNARLQARVAELEEALKDIASTSTDCSPAEDEASHYRQVAWGVIGIAARAVLTKGDE